MPQRTFENVVDAKVKENITSGRLDKGLPSDVYGLSDTGAGSNGVYYLTIAANGKTVFDKDGQKIILDMSQPLIGAVSGNAVPTNRQAPVKQIPPVVEKVKQ